MSQDKIKLFFWYEKSWDDFIALVAFELIRQMFGDKLFSITTC